LTDAEVYDARTSIGHNGLLASVAVLSILVLLVDEVGATYRGLLHHHWSRC